MLLTVTYPVLPKRNSVRASLVMDHFGISHDSHEHVLARDLEVPLQPGDVVLFTGASGSGKSSLLREVVRQIGQTSDKWQVPSAKAEGFSPLGTCPLPLATSQPPLLLDLPTLPLGNKTLVDAIPLPFEEALQLLAMCGLGEAPLLLRTPQELSEGQRYRFALALAVALKPQWIIADEFTAVLDRTTAKVIAYNVRRIADRYGVGFLLATAQGDVAADLSPDLCVTCDLDGRMTVTRPTTSVSPLPPGEGLGVRAEPPDRVSLSAISPKSLIGEDSPDASDLHATPATSEKSPTIGRANGPVPPPSLNAPRKKKDPRSPSTATSGSAPPPVATGRISLGGIIAVTTSG